MGSTTVAGSTLSISADTPASYDEAGFTALNFLEIGGVEKIGTIGAVYAKVDFKPLKGAAQKRKGSPDYGALAPSLAHDDGDPGQILLRTAADDTSIKLYAFKVTYPTGAKRYFRGRVFGYPEVIDGAETILQANPTVEISTRVVKSGEIILPTVSISSSLAKAEGNSGVTAFTYTVTRSATSGPVLIPWSFAAGNTTAGDFQGGAYPTGGTVTLADGVASGTFTVSVVGDTAVEPDETFSVAITAPSGYALGSPTSATGTILNDDVPTISGSLPNATAGQPYDTQLTVVPAGTPVTLSAGFADALAAKNITHNGFGRFQSTGVTL